MEAAQESFELAAAASSEPTLAYEEDIRLPAFGEQIVSGGAAPLAFDDAGRGLVGASSVRRRLVLDDGGAKIV